MTVFIRVIDHDVHEKADALRRAITHLADKESDDSAGSQFVFERVPDEFAAVPGSPFAYWAPRRCLKTFTLNEPLNKTPRLIVSTNPLNADFRFVRVWWEPHPNTLGNAWCPWAKGGAYSPHYYDVHTIIAWFEKRQSYDGFLGTENRPLERPASVQHFFRPGLTWPRRTNGLSFRVMPRGCIFADKGPAMFVDGDKSDELLAYSALLNSRTFGYLVSVQLGRTELAQSYEVGLIQQTPISRLTNEDIATLARLGRRAWSLKRSLDTSNETSHAFILPTCLNEKITALDRAFVERELAAIQGEIDEATYMLYGIAPEDRAAIEAQSERGVSANASEYEEVDGEDAGEDEGSAGVAADTVNSWLVGVAFGRFDPRLATGERAIPPEPEPFDPLPRLSPGMWPVGEGPARSHDILVDDKGHADDIASLAREVTERIPINGSENLRAWLAQEFFPLHIKMYSKSRRKAPIYWQLATPSANYSVWLYIHAFTRDTLFRVQNDYVAPKLVQENRRLESMKSELSAGGGAAPRKETAAQEGFVEDLRTFLEEIKRVAPLWNPNLDDGVIINFAPLWRLVPQHKAWQKELKATWDTLCEGKYDWAHLAMLLWSERVVPKCAGDRSLAIAHGLEDAFWEQDATGTWKERETLIWSIEELVTKRSAAAVKAALKSLLEAPDPSGSTKRGRKSKAA